MITAGGGQIGTQEGDKDPLGGRTDERGMMRFSFCVIDTKCAPPQSVVPVLYPLPHGPKIHGMFHLDHLGRLARGPDGALKT